MLNVLFLLCKHRIAAHHITLPNGARVLVKPESRAFDSADGEKIAPLRRTMRPFASGVNKSSFDHFRIEHYGSRKCVHREHDSQTSDASSCPLDFLDLLGPARVHQKSQMDRKLFLQQDRRQSLVSPTLPMLPIACSPGTHTSTAH